MPFKLGFRKAKKYNVSSKNAFVVCVRLLNNKLTECTLTNESTGEECLENIAQKLELTETEYFGLGYDNKKLQFRWCELDKPLKKQLDKYATESAILYFGVMFYESDVSRLQDEMTRSQYYLQLKNNVLEEKLSCTPEQAVLLAAYSLQAEFGDHDYEKHTLDYFKDTSLLPKSLLTDDTTYTNLLLNVLRIHANLEGYHRAEAQLQYIIQAQQLEDCGIEYYPARDESGTELKLGASYIGIFVKQQQGQPTEYFKWDNIIKLTCNKRTFGIVNSLSEKPVHYLLDDPELAKYVHKICTLQQQFYKERHSELRSSSTDKNPSISEASIGSVGPIPDIQQSVQIAHDISDNSDSLNSSSIEPVKPPPEPLDRGPEVEGSTQALLEAQARHLSNNNIYNSTPTVPLANSKQHITHQSVPDLNNHDLSMNIHDVSLNNDVSSVHINDQSVNIHDVSMTGDAQVNVQESQYENLPHQYNIHQPHINDIVPPYREVPSFDHVMQQLTDQQHQQQVFEQQMANIANTQVYSRQEGLAYSQPEISHQVHHAQTPMLNYLNEHHHSHGQIGNGGPMYTEYHPHSNGGAGYHYGKPVDRTSSLIIYPTYSTPEFTGISQSVNQYSISENRINEQFNDYKAPPPYPRNSNSTPDLALQLAITHANSSPDLVSRRNFVNTNLADPRSYDANVENMTVDMSQLHVNRVLNQAPPLEPELNLRMAQAPQIEPDPGVFGGQGQIHLHPMQQQKHGMYKPPSMENIPDIAVEAQMRFANSENQRQNEEKEVFIMDPPNYNAMGQSIAASSHSSLSLKQHLVQSQSNSPPQYQVQARASPDINPLPVFNAPPPPGYPHSQIDQSGHCHSQIDQSGYSPSQIDQSALIDSQTPISNLNTFIVPMNEEDYINQTDNDSINCLDVTNLSEPDSNPNHSKTSSQDTSLSYSPAVHSRDVTPAADQSRTNVVRADTDQSTASPVVPPRLTGQEREILTAHIQGQVTPVREPQEPVHSHSNSYVDSDAVVVRRNKSAPNVTTQAVDISKRLSLSALRMAAMSGTTINEPPSPDEKDETDNKAPNKRKQLEQFLESGNLPEIFENIPGKKIKCEISTGSHPDNTTRNRFKDIVPYDGNRVKITPTKENKTGYINASHIKIKIAGEEYWYIATQGPLPSTLVDFWQMIWEQEVEVIAMLTGLLEFGKQKCEKYWPDQIGPKHKMKVGNYTVYLKFRNDSSIYVTSGFVLKHKSGRERLIWHLQYNDWPDHGCPVDHYGFLAYLDEIESVTRHTFMERKDGRKTPVVVHCSAGVGRSGVVILSELMKACLEHNEDTDVGAMLWKMREQRMHMVQTDAQYEFIFKTLIDYLKCSRLI